MTEYLLNTKIVHEASHSVIVETGDNSWILILIAIAIISGIVFFKKKFVKVLLSFALVFSFVALAPVKSFADHNVSITSSAEVSEGSPAELTITNNDNYAVSISSFEITNQALPQDTTWNISIKDNYEIKEAGNFDTVSFDIPAHSEFSFFVYPNVEEIPVGELCDISFKAVSTHYNATYRNNDGDDSVVAENNFDFSFATFENADNTKLNRQIASVEAAFACIPNTYNNIFFDNVSYDISDRLAFMRTLGFEDNYYCKLWPDKHLDTQADEGVSVTLPDYAKDKNDVTSFCFNHKKINFGNHYSEIINISVGATGGSFEWASNFDFGADESTDYWKDPYDPNEHPEWTDREDHKGFDIAKNRLLSAYNSYYENYVDNDSDVNKIILINGHSRGGGISNLLGKYFEDLSQGENIKTFTYTFAAPNATSVQLNSDYNTIFNIANRDDLVSQFPGNISAFYKYGKDVDLSLYEDAAVDGNTMQNIFKNKSGYGDYNGNDPAYVESLINSMWTLIPDRNSAYTLDSPSSLDYLKLGLYDSEAAARNDIPNFLEHLKKNNLDRYADIYQNPVEDELNPGKYRIKFKCCVAFIMQDISNFLFLNGADLDKYQPSIGYNPELIDILKEALGIIPGVVHGHIWMSYNLLASYDKY